MIHDTLGSILIVIFFLQQVDDWFLHTLMWTLQRLDFRTPERSQFKNEFRNSDRRMKKTSESQFNELQIEELAKIKIIFNSLNVRNETDLVFRVIEWETKLIEEIFRPKYIILFSHFFPNTWILSMR